MFTRPGNSKIDWFQWPLTAAQSQEVGHHPSLVRVQQAARFWTRRGVGVVAVAWATVGHHRLTVHIVPLNSQCHIGPLTGHIGPCPWLWTYHVTACSSARDILTLNWYFFLLWLLVSRRSPCCIGNLCSFKSVFISFFGLQPFVCH